MLPNISRARRNLCSQSRPSPFPTQFCPLQTEAPSWGTTPSGPGLGEYASQSKANRCVTGTAPYSRPTKILQNAGQPNANLVRTLLTTEVRALQMDICPVAAAISGVSSPQRSLLSNYGEVRVFWGCTCFSSIVLS
jgi:hypothetical protein